MYVLNTVGGNALLILHVMCYVILHFVVTM